MSRVASNTFLPLAGAPELRRPATPAEARMPAGGATRWLLWLYLAMLLMEGAARKWFLPSLSSPLLVVRDPVAILIYATAAAGGFYPRGRLVTFFWAVMAGMLIFGLMTPDLNWGVYLFGVRTNFLHLPLIFLIPQIWGHEEVVRLGRWFLLISLPMAVLVVMQFLAGPGHILNVAVGGVGDQLATSGGRLRASGTFSFTSGIIAFFALACAFALNGWLRRGSYPYWLLIASSVAIAVAVSTSGSRSAVLMVALVCGIVIPAVLVDPRMMGRSLAVLVLLAVVGGLVSQLDVVQSGVDVLNSRFVESGGRLDIFTRVLKQFTHPLTSLGQARFFGAGLGYGTNAGSSLATGSISFLLSENEWDRIILESGPLMGPLFILWRVATVIFLGRISYRSMQEGNVLPLLLLSASGMLILNGSLGQPTTLGFASLGGGLCLAAAGRKEEAPVAAGPAAAPHVRGQSRYAKHLHDAARRRSRGGREA